MTRNTFELKSNFETHGYNTRNGNLLHATSTASTMNISTQSYNAMSQNLKSITALQIFKKQVKLYLQRTTS